MSLNVNFSLDNPVVSVDEMLNQKNGKLFCSQFHQTFYEQLLHQYSFTKKLQSQTVIREKLRKTLLCKKASKFVRTLFRQLFLHTHVCTYVKKAAEKTTYVRKIRT